MNKWMKIGLVATVAALMGALAFSAPAFAQAGTPPVQGRGAGYGLGVRGAWGGSNGSLVAVAAEVLDMDRAKLIAALAEGQTIADVAAARGVAPEAIVDAALADRAGFLAQAVADGRLTQAQADTMLATMDAHLTAQLSAVHTPNARGMGVGVFVDADGDGVCDNLGAGGARQGRGGRWGR